MGIVRGEFLTRGWSRAMQLANRGISFITCFSPSIERLIIHRMDIFDVVAPRSAEVSCHGLRTFKIFKKCTFESFWNKFCIFLCILSDVISITILWRYMENNEISLIRVGGNVVPGVALFVKPIHVKQVTTRISCDPPLVTYSIHSNPSSICYHDLWSFSTKGYYVKRFKFARSKKRLRNVVRDAALRVSVRKSNTRDRRFRKLSNFVELERGWSRDVLEDRFAVDSKISIYRVAEEPKMDAAGDQWNFRTKPRGPGAAQTSSLGVTTRRWDQRRTNPLPTGKLASLCLLGRNRVGNARPVRLLEQKGGHDVVEIFKRTWP